MTLRFGLAAPKTIIDDARSSVNSSCGRGTDRFGAPEANCLMDEDSPEASAHPIASDSASLDEGPSLVMNDDQSDIATITRLELYFAVRQFTRTMRRFAEILDHDYDMVMIFFIIVESCFQSIIPLGGAKADRAALEAAYLDSISIGLPILGVGEASGIPRETVRRKVKRLTEMGYLAVTPHSKNIYVPLSTLLDRTVVDAFANYATDIDQLVKNLQYYSRSTAGS
jgi:hypothetical protein